MQFTHTIDQTVESTTSERSGVDTLQAIPEMTFTDFSTNQLDDTNITEY